MRILLAPGEDDGGGSTEPKIERIQLVVECPSQDFSKQGGLADALKALELLDLRWDAMNDKFRRGFQFGGPGGSIGSAGEIKLTVSGSAIHAALAPGEKIVLNLKGADFTIAGGGGTPGTGGSGVTPPAGGAEEGIGYTSADGRRVLYQRTKYLKGGESYVARERESADEFDRAYRDISRNKSGAVTGMSLHEFPQGTGQAEIEVTILRKKEELQKAITAGVTQEFEAHQALAATIRKEVSDSDALNAKQKAAYMAQAASYERRGVQAEFRGLEKQTNQSFRSQFDAEEDARMAAIEQASRNNRAAQLRRTRTTEREEDARMAAEDRRAALYQKASLEADLEATAATGRIPSSMTPASRRRREAEIDQQRHSRKYGAAYDMAQQSGGAEGQGYDKKAVQQFGEYTRATLAANVANDQFNESTRLIGKNMLQNIKHVATWAASVGVLYGSIHLLTRSLEENMEIAKEMAILGVIFGQGYEAVSRLTDGVLHLAAANGQSASEAMKSATEWARIFHTEQEVLTATNASLMLANVSGQEAAHTTEFLSMMVMVYKLRATELNAVIGEMARISQTANVTNLDLMHGMEAVGEAAKEAGMSWSQTMGVITGGVSATKQSGTTIANTLKTMITQMANPEIQEKLRLGAGVEVTGAGGELKGMNQILNEMYVSWERMTDAERRSMLFSVGGRQNATRMAGILDEFIVGQVKAINAQLSLNSAEKENQAIVSTLKGQVAGLASEWDKFVNIQGQGPIRALTDITTYLKNILELLNHPGISVLATLLGAAGVASGARMMVSGFKLNAEQSESAGTKGGIFVSSFRAIRNDVTAAGEVMKDVSTSGVKQFNWLISGIPSISKAATISLDSMTLSTRALGFAFATLADVVLPLLAIWGGIKLFNFEASKLSGGDQSRGRVTDIEAATNAIEAHRNRGDVIRTAISVIGSEEASQQRKILTAQQVAGAVLPNADSAALSAREKHYELLIKEGRQMELLAELGLEEANAARMSVTERAKTIQLLDVEIAHDNENIQKREQHEKLSLATRVAMWMDPFSWGRELSTPSGSADEWRNTRDENVRKRLALQQDTEANFASADYTKKLTQIGEFGAAESMATQGINAGFGLLGAASPLDERNRKLAELMSRQSWLNAQMESLPKQPGADLRGTPFEGLGTDIGPLKERFQKEVAENQAQINEMNRTGGAAEMENTRLGVFGRVARAEFGSLAQGLTPGEQAAYQFREGTKTRDAYDRMEGDESARVASISFTVDLEKSRLSAVEKIYETEKEIANVKMQERRDYERSLLTSGPAELLRRLAVNQLTQGGTRRLTGGEFFSMSPAAREDYMRMPDNTQQDRDLQRSLRAFKAVADEAAPKAPVYLPHFSEGGSINQGQLSIVGEKGPELFRPSSSGEIIPAPIDRAWEREWHRQQKEKEQREREDAIKKRRAGGLIESGQYDPVYNPTPVVDRPRRNMESPILWSTGPDQRPWLPSLSGGGGSPVYYNDDGTRTSTPIPKHSSVNGVDMRPRRTPIYHPELDPAYGDPEGDAKRDATDKEATERAHRQHAKNVAEANEKWASYKSAHATRQTSPSNPTAIGWSRMNRAADAAVRGTITPGQYSGAGLGISEAAMRAIVRLGTAADHAAAALEKIGAPSNIGRGAYGTRTPAAGVPANMTASTQSELTGVHPTSGNIPSFHQVDPGSGFTSDASHW